LNDYTILTQTLALCKHDFCLVVSGLPA